MDDQRNDYDELRCAARASSTVQQHWRCGSVAECRCCSGSGSGRIRTGSGALVQPRSIRSASRLHSGQRIPDTSKSAGSDVAESRSVAQQAVFARCGSHRGTLRGGVQFPQSCKWERSGHDHRQRVGAKRKCRQDHWIDRRASLASRVTVQLLMLRFALLIGIAAIAFAEQPILRVPLSVQSDTLLTAKDFKAQVYGLESVKVARVRTPEDDMVLMVVMDVVGDLALVDPARQALANRLKRLPDNVLIGILRAQEGLQVRLDPTADRAAIENSIMSLPVSGKAGLLDTIATASQVAESVGVKTGVRLAILYVTDSEVRNY